MRFRPALLALGLILSQAPASAQETTRGNGIALFGKPGLPADFKNFPYVNPDAPKGGEVVLASLGSFDSFNTFIMRGAPAAEVSRVYDTLLRQSADEAGVSYGLLAKTIEIPEDRMWVAFELRPEAHFHDGHPVTAEDVVWTFETLRDKGRPNFRQYYANVDRVVAESPLRVVFHFKSNEDHELPLIVGEFPILPKHWWAGRDFTQPLTVAPLGSGPYRLDRFDLGSSTTLVRVPDYWARDLPVSKGLFNIDIIRTEYYRDATVAMEAFKSGQVDYRRENIAKNWATAYDFPAVEKGLVKKQTFPNHLPTGMQGFVMNTRRPQFSDPRVRDALDEVFDFEWLNRNLFFGAYTRTDSYFSNSDLASSGLPQGDELALLTQFKDKLPPDLFTQPFKLPVTDGSGNNRHGLRRALNLFEQAGWKVTNRKLVDASGKQMSFEILSSDPTYERIVIPYIQWLSRLGIDAHVRTVDAPQYQRLTDTFDFDMTMVVLPESDFPGNEQRDYWSCAARKAEGSSNLAGVCDPVVDALVKKVIEARDVTKLSVATKALDRVLLWSWYVVPNWHIQSFNAAFWDRFGHPAQPVRTGIAFDSWWVDAKLAAATDAARRSGL